MEEIGTQAQDLFVQIKTVVFPWGVELPVPVDLTREYLRYEISKVFINQPK